MTKLLWTTAVFAALACVPAPEGAGQTFPVSETTRPAKECVEIGRVEGRPWSGNLGANLAASAAVEDLKKAAAAAGGNYVRVDRMEWLGKRGAPRGVATGTALLCATEPR